MPNLNIIIGNLEPHIKTQENESGIEVEFPRGGDASIRANADRLIELLVKSLAVKNIPVETQKAGSEYLLRDSREKGAATPARILAVVQTVLNEVEHRLRVLQEDPPAEELTGEKNIHAAPKEPDDDSDLAQVLKAMIFEKNTALGHDNVSEKEKFKNAETRNRLRNVIYTPLTDFNRTSPVKLDAQTIAADIATEIVEARNKVDGEKILDDKTIVSQILSKHIIKADKNDEPAIAAKKFDRQKALVDYLGDNILMTISRHEASRSNARGA